MTDYFKGDELRRAAYRLMDEIESRRVQCQSEVPTAFDKMMWQLMDRLSRLPANVSWEDSCQDISGPEGKSIREGLVALKAYLHRRSMGRYVDYEKRLEIRRCDLTPPVFAMSGGVQQSVHWKGMPLFKTAFDMAIVSMLTWDLKPTLVVEIGSGTGSSAIWIADMLRLHGVSGQVISFDIKRPDIEYDGVTFLQGDCHRIHSDFDEIIFEGNKGPVLLLEDAHVNVEGVLEYFSRHLKPGDYVMIEDSWSKNDAIRGWLSHELANQNTYLVDTHYVDYFGQNATCASDSIFVSMN